MNKVVFSSLRGLVSVTPCQGRESPRPGGVLGRREVASPSFNMFGEAGEPSSDAGADGAGRGFGVVVVGGGCDLWNNGSNFSAQSF